MVAILFLASWFIGIKGEGSKLNSDHVLPSQVKPCQSTRNEFNSSILFPIYTWFQTFSCQISHLVSLGGSVPLTSSLRLLGVSSDCAHNLGVETKNIMSGSLSKAPSGNWEVIFSKQNSGCNKSPGSHSSVTVRSPPFSARDKEFGRSDRLLFLFYSGDFQVCSAERVGVSLKERFSLVSVWQEKAVRPSQTCGYRDLQHDQGPVVLL